METKKKKKNIEKKKFIFRFLLIKKHSQLKISY